MPHLYSVKEAADKLGKSVPTVYNMINDGRLSVEKLGPKCWRIPEDEIARVNASDEGRHQEDADRAVREALAAAVRADGSETVRQLFDAVQALNQGDFQAAAHNVALVVIDDCDAPRFPELTAALTTLSNIKRS